MDVEGSGHGITRYYPGIFLEGLRKTMKTFSQYSRPQADIRIWDFPNTQQEHYPLDRELVSKQT
jgi:hypothetical protein